MRVATPELPWSQTPQARPSLSIAYVIGVGAASLVAMLLALAARLELLSPTQTLMDADAFRQVALLRDAIFAVGVALPSVSVLGHLIVPRHDNVRVARLERLAAAAQLGGGLALLAASAGLQWGALLLVDGAAVLVAAGSLAQAIAFVVRVRAPRPRGDAPSLAMRALALTATAELVALPIALSLFVLLAVERVTGLELWHGAGAHPLAFEHWLRICLKPLVYIAVVPCLGVVADALTSNVRPVVMAMAAMLLLGGVAWGARLFGGDDAAAVAVASFFSLALLVPMTVAVGNLMAAAPSPGATRWLALAFVCCFVELGVTALPLAMADIGQSLQANAFAAAHHDLLLGALAFGVAAALHHFWPGLAADHGERLAKIGCLIAFVGLQIAVVPQLIAGTRGMPVTFEYPSPLRWFAAIAGVGWLLAAAGASLMGANLLASLRRLRIAH
jgi:heme/copper-type cytochrome/quinol oxidase subunit 1